MTTAASGDVSVVGEHGELLLSATRDVCGLRWSIVANTDLLALRSSREALRNTESKPTEKCFAMKYENSTAKNIHAPHTTERSHASHDCALE